MYYICTMNSANDWNLTEEDQKQIKKIKKLRITISTVIALIGIGILLLQIFPLANSWLKAKILETKVANLISPVPGSEKRTINGEFAYWDPSQSYFENLTTEAGKIAQSASTAYNTSNTTANDIIIDQEYSKPMSLTIDSLDIHDITVTPNVHSYEEDIYNAVLKNGLAHFQGTPVCGDGGNCFIYGHSAVQSYFQRHTNDPETIFTRLEDIEIGAKIKIKRDGEILEYKVRRIKVVEPTDFSPLQSQANKETVTLMTCTPIGIGTHRLIVVGDRIN